MKSRKLFTILTLCAGITLSGLNSCTEDFEKINDDPLKATQLDPKYQFTYAQLKFAGGGHEEWRGNLIYTLPLSGLSTCLYDGGQGFYNQDDHTRAKWEAEYEGTVKNLEDILAKMRTQNEDGSLDNKIAAARVMRALTYQRLTDLYGDIPYSEAGQGYNELVYLPKYDTQEFIYNDLIKECTEAAAQFDANKLTYGDNDLFYGGDVTQWKKLANSVKLRLGMRLTKVDAALAQKTVEEAIAAGVMTSADDIAFINHTTDGGPWGNHENGSGSANNGKNGGFAHAYISEYFLEMMKESKDPRIFEFAAVIYLNQGEYLPYKFAAIDPFKPMAKLGEGWNDQILLGSKPGDQWPAGYMGLYAEKNGEDISVVSANYTSSRNAANDESMFNVLCGINTQVVGSRTAPTIVMGYAEVEFLLAEAAVRGWGASDAQVHYEAGIRAAIERYPNLYPGQDYVNDWMASNSFDYNSGIDAYIANANIQWDAAKGLELIATEKWKSFFMNGYEAFSELRRTGYPSGVLSTVPKDIELNLYNAGDLTTPIGTHMIQLHSGGETNFVRSRRLPYPSRESLVNTTNYEEAVARQGNALTDRVWWDKE